MKNKIAEMSTEALQKSLKASTIITSILGFTLGFLIVSALYRNVFVWRDLAVPLCLSPILFLNIANIYKMKAELKSRGI